MRKTEKPQEAHKKTDCQHVLKNKSQNVRDKWVMK